SEAAKFSGENFIRYTGEVVEANQAQVFAWGARTKGIDVHALAEPTKLEALRKEYEQASKHVKEDTKNSLLEKYGGEEHLKAPPKELLLAQTESYVEYNRSGKVVKGQERPAMKSRYEEDVFPNNHTSIWGSYFKNGQWGYKCCHQFLKNTYCIGERGFQLEDEMFAVAEAQRKAQPAKAEESTDDVKEDEEKTKAEDPSSLKSEDGPAKKIKKKKGSDGDDTASELSSGSGTDASEGEEEVEGEEDQERLQEQERRRKEEKRRTKKREKRQRRKERRKNKVVDEKKPRKKRASGSDDDYLSESGSESDSSSSGSDSDSESRKKKLSKEVRKAMKKQKKELREGRRMNEMGDRKRKYHSNYEVKPPTEAELEAYNRVRIHASDPMAALLQEKSQKKRRKNEEE
ncbi:Zinc knuckle family protein, partial [Aphelenchoides avenae]